MKEQDKVSKKRLTEPRRRAEPAAVEKSSGTSDVSTLSTEKVQPLIHELQVHQIEPETQKEELHRAQQDLEVSQDKYSELYDFAPVGYFTLDQSGVILDANLTASGLLSIARTFLIGRPLARFVGEEDRKALDIHFRQLLETQSKQTCEVLLTKKDGSQISVRLDSLVLESPDASSTILRTAVTDITKGKHADEALYTAESRYRRLFESARDGILILELDTGKILDVNRYLIDMLGYSHEEFLEKYLWEVSPFRDTALNKEAFAELQQKGYIRYEDLPLETSDGRSIAVEFISNSYFLNGMTFIQCNISDITERKRTEEALRKNEALLKEAQRVAQIGHWELDLATGIFSWSEEVFHIFGLDPERGEVSLADHRDLILPEYVELLDGSVAKASTQGTPYDIELRLVRPDGSIRWLNVKGSPIRNVEGAIFRLFGIAQDITDRKTAEGYLKASTERFRGLIESSPIGISIFRQGQPQYVNPAVMHMFGYESEGEILELGVEDLYEPGSGYLIKKLVTTSLEGMPVPYHQEARGLKRSGEAFDISIWMVKTEFEGDPAILTFVLDVSAEKSLRSQLFQAQKMEAVGTLAGGIAHDFNNLLTVVIGFSELLLIDTDEQDPAYADLQKINKAGQKGADLVGRLLSFSRKSEVNLYPLNLNHQIEQLEKMLTRTIPKMIKIELSLADALFIMDPINWTGG